MDGGTKGLGEAGRGGWGTAKDMDVAALNIGREAERRPRMDGGAKGLGDAGRGGARTRT